VADVVLLAVMALITGLPIPEVEKVKFADVATPDWSEEMTA